MVELRLWDCVAGLGRSGKGVGRGPGRLGERWWWWWGIGDEIEGGRGWIGGRWEDERKVAEERFPSVECMMRVLDGLVLGTGEEAADEWMERWKGWAGDDGLEAGAGEV